DKVNCYLMKIRWLFWDHHSSLVGMRAFVVNKLGGYLLMLDRKLLRTNFDEINKRLDHRGEDLSDLVKFGELDEKRRELISKVEELKAERNEATKQISELKKNKEDATDAITAMRALGGEIKELDNELVEID